VNVQIIDDTPPDKVDLEIVMSVGCENVNIEDPIELGISIVNTSGCAVEVKNLADNNASLTECYFNMLGAGTRLATMLLQYGKIVKKVTMFGVVVSMQDLDKV